MIKNYIQPSFPFIVSTFPALMWNTHELDRNFLLRGISCCFRAIRNAYTVHWVLSFIASSALHMAEVTDQEVKQWGFGGRTKWFEMTNLAISGWFFFFFKSESRNLDQKNRMMGRWFTTLEADFRVFQDQFMVWICHIRECSLDFFSSDQTGMRA